MSNHDIFLVEIYLTALISGNFSLIAEYISIARYYSTSFYWIRLAFGLSFNLFFSHYR